MDEADRIAVAECHDCDDLAVGATALAWALRHTEAMDHATTARQPV